MSYKHKFSWTNQRAKIIRQSVGLKSKSRKASPRRERMWELARLGIICKRVMICIIKPYKKNSGKIFRNWWKGWVWLAWQYSYLEPQTQKESVPTHKPFPWVSIGRSLGILWEGQETRNKLPLVVQGHWKGLGAAVEKACNTSGTFYPYEIKALSHRGRGTNLNTSRIHLKYHCGWQWVKTRYLLLTRERQKTVLDTFPMSINTIRGFLLLVMGGGESRNSWTKPNKNTRQSLALMRRRDRIMRNSYHKDLGRPSTTKTGLGQDNILPPH